MRMTRREPWPGATPCQFTQLYLLDPDRNILEIKARRNHGRLVLFTSGVRREWILDHEKTRAMNRHEHWKATKPEPREFEDPSKGRRTRPLNEVVTL
jgi:hypothetical protein